MASNSMLANLQNEFDTIQKSLKDVDENIKKLTGRDPEDFRNGPPGQRKFQGNIENRPRISQWNNGNAPSYNGFGEGGNFPRRRFAPGPNAPFPKRMRLEHPPRDESPEEEELPNKPNVPSTVVATGRHSKTRRDTIEQQKKDGGLERNRRMFGVILGTLQQFQQEQSTSKDKLSKREEIEKKVEEAAEKERQEIKKERQELFVSRREKRAKIRCLEQKLELAKMFDCWEASRRKMQKYIQTSTQPKLFYLPARLNSKTEKLLKESQHKIEEEINQKRSELEAQLKEIDQCYTRDDHTAATAEEEMEEENTMKMEEESFTQNTAEQETPQSPTETSKPAPQEQPSATTTQDVTMKEEDHQDPAQQPEAAAPNTAALPTEDGEKPVAALADQEFEPIYDDE